MSGPSKDRSKGIAIPIDFDISKPFGTVQSTLAGVVGATKKVSDEEQARERASLPANLAAKELGFDSEADRVAKVSKIINAFGSTRRKAPKILTQGATGAGKVV